MTMTDTSEVDLYQPDQAILDLPPIQDTKLVERLGADGRKCIATVVRYFSSPIYVRVKDHEVDNYYRRDLLGEEVIASSQCAADEVDQAEFTAIGFKRASEAEKAKESAAKARAAVSDARADAIATLAKNAGLTAEQTEALFGRSLSPVVKEVVEAVATKR